MVSARCCILLTVPSLNSVNGIIIPLTVALLNSVNGIIIPLTVPSLNRQHQNMF